MMNLQTNNQEVSRRGARGMLLMGLFLTLAVSAGCKKSNDNSQQIAGRSARGSMMGAVPYGQTQVNPQTGQVYQTQTAYVTTQASYSDSFQAQVQALVSGQMDPQYLGRVSPTDGVMIRAYVEVDQQGRVIPQNSKISIEIRDEYTNQRDSSGNVIGPVTMTVPAYQGYAYNGQLQLVFQDSVGQVAVVGAYQNGGILNAQFYFANSRRFDGTSVNMQMTALGNFQMQTCGFFRCQ